MKKILTAVSASILLVSISTAQAAQKTESGTEATDVTVPWLYEGSDVPVDKSWTFGALENGLRYAVKKNEVPDAQISIRVRIDAGSLYEKDDERGFAHLIEHLAFRGSEYVPDGESKRIWQRFGATFGSDSNAQTTPTQTVYKLDLPNSTPEKFNESMKILSGMMRAPNLTGRALDAERSIVLAEMRENNGAQQKMGDAMRAHLFQGQLLADRSPIGTVEALNAATAQGLQAFHKRWYRPDKAVIVIAGDVEPALLEAAIKQHFSNWNVEGPPAPQPDFGTVKTNAKTSDIYVDPNLPESTVIAWLRPWEKVDDTIIYNEGLLLDALALRIINRRLETAARRGASFLYAQVAQEDVARSADITTIIASPIGDDWETAIKDVRAVVADAISSPPSLDDIERERALFVTALQTGLDSYPFEAAAKQADNIVNAVDIAETVAAPDVVVKVFADMRDQLTPENIQASTKRLFSGDDVRIFLSTTKDVAGGDARVSAALNAKIDGNASSRLVQKDISFDQLPKLGKPGKVLTRRKSPFAIMEQVLFENGTRALLYSNDGETDQIRVLVRFGKGYQSVASKDAGLLWTGPLVINENGIGKYDQTQIEALANGRRFELNFGIDEGAFEFSAVTSPDDFADQMKLIATKMEYPGWNKAPLARAQAFVETGYDSYQVSAGSVLQRDLNYLMSNNDLRWKSPTPQEANRVTHKDFRKFWEPLLASGPVEVIVMGDFKTEAVIKALEESVGALKLRKPGNFIPAANQLSFPKGQKQAKELFHDGPSDQAAAIVAWPTLGGVARSRENHELEVLAAIFRDRLYEKFRAEKAASYSPNMSNYWPTEFNSGGYLMSISLVQPKDVESFYAFSEEVAKDLTENLVTDDELKRAIEPIKQYIERASSGNTFWINGLEGSSFNTQKFAALRGVFKDFDLVTPERLQMLASRYFVKEKSWKLKVLPRGKTTQAADNDNMKTTNAAASR